MSKLSKMIFGITGKIASGKSTFTKIVASLGYPIFDCDLRVKDIYNIYKKEIIELIGINYFKNNHFDFAKIRAESLRDISFDRKLKLFIYGVLKEEIIIFINENKNCSNLFIDAPLLFEAKFNHLVDKIVFVDCSEEIRKERLLKRGKISIAELERFELLSFPNEYKKSLSDIVINNDGTIEELNKKISKIIKK